MLIKEEFDKKSTFFLAALRNMRDLGSLTRDRTCAPLQWKHRVLNTGPPGKSPEKHLTKLTTVGMTSSEMK